MTCNRNCDCVGECKAGLDKPTTPTDDLRARQAELDARTIYDIACIREARPGATREDVDFKAIALRNWEAIAAVPVEALEGLVGNWKRFAEARGGADPVADDQRPGLAIAADELTQLIKERSNG